MAEKIFELLKEIKFSAFLDIGLMSLIVYTVLVWFKRTRVAFVLTGILICGIFYLLSYQFDLFLISSVLRAFFAVILIAMIVIFQEELKHLFEQIAVWSLNPKLGRKKLLPLLRSEVEMLVRTLSDLSRERVGALIVIQGSDLILRHLQGGIDLNGEASESLLKSLFDPHSMGHDGALILDKAIVTRFGCHLPLSKDFTKLKNRGTRHAAALGLSELCDALCLVVSEERGTLSVMHHGQITAVEDPSHLSKILQTFYGEINPTKKENRWQDFLKKNSREKVLAIVATIALWFVIIHESELVHKTFRVPVEYAPFASNLEVTSIDPEDVLVTFSGPRNVFHFLNEKDIRLFLNLYNSVSGVKTITLSKSNMTYPKDLSVEYIEPRHVKIRIDELLTESK